METSLIPDQNHVDIPADLASHLFQEDVDDLGVDVRGKHAHGLTGCRTDRPKDIEPIILGLLDCRWTRAGGSPLATQRALLPESRFVLEPDFDPFARMLSGDPRHVCGRFFLNSAWACGSACAWRGRGIKQLYPKRWSSS